MTTNIIIQQLSKDTTEEQVREFCKQIAPVEEIAFQEAKDGTHEALVTLKADRATVDPLVAKYNGSYIGGSKISVYAMVFFK